MTFVNKWQCKTRSHLLETHKAVSAIKHADKGTKVMCPVTVYNSCKPLDSRHKYLIYISFTLICMRSSLFWDVTQRRLVVSYRRFGTSYRSQLQGSIFKGRTVDWLIHEDGTDRLSRNVGNYQYTLRYIPEERICHLYVDGSLEFNINVLNQTLTRLSLKLRFQTSHNRCVIYFSRKLGDLYWIFCSFN
jgi:hypothetical protein